MTGQAGVQVGVATRIDGATGEFLVNDVTENNQRFAAVGMGVNGDIVVSWTSSGQDGDAAYETNIYAKQLDRNEVIRGSSNMDTGTTMGNSMKCAASTPTRLPLHWVTIVK